MVIFAIESRKKKKHDALEDATLTARLVRELWKLDSLPSSQTKELRRVIRRRFRDMYGDRRPTRGTNDYDVTDAFETNATRRRRGGRLLWIVVIIALLIWLH